MRYLALLLVGLTVAFPAAAQPCHDAPPASHAESSAGAAEDVDTDDATGEDADAPAPLAGVHPCGAPPDAICACCVSGAIAPATTTAERQPTTAVVDTERRDSFATTARITATPVRGPPRSAPPDTQGPRGPPTADALRA